MSGSDVLDAPGGAPTADDRPEAAEAPPPLTPADVAGETMKAVQMYSPYGYRGRIGLIVPSTNTINEPEFYLMAPHGVSVHTARMKLLGKATRDSYLKMEAETERAAAELGTAEVDVVAWGCTSGSVICPTEAIEAKMRRIARAPAVTTISAVVAALKAFGVERVALGTPYVSFVNDSEVEFLARAGFEVVSMYGLQLGETQEERRGIGRVPPESLHRFARLIDRPEADAIFFSCTNLATVEQIAGIEAEVGKPVVTSNQATFWRSLRLMGIRQKVEGFGRLLEEH